MILFFSSFPLFQGSYNNSFSSTSSSVQSGVARSTSREQGLALDGAVMDGRSQDRTAAQENLAFLQLEVMNLQKEKERVTLQVVTYTHRSK